MKTFVVPFEKTTVRRAAVKVRAKNREEAVAKASHIRFDSLGFDKSFENGDENVEMLEDEIEEEKFSKL